MIELAKEYIKNSYKKVSYLDELAKHEEFKEFTQVITSEEEAKQFLLERNVIQRSERLPFSYLKLIQKPNGKLGEETFQLTTQKEKVIISLPCTMQCLGRIDTFRKFQDDGKRVECYSNNLKNSDVTGDLCFNCQDHKGKCKRFFDLVINLGGVFAIWSVSGAWGFNLLKLANKCEFTVKSSNFSSKGIKKVREVVVTNVSTHDYDPQGYILTAVRIYRGSSIHTTDTGAF